LPFADDVKNPVPPEGIPIHPKVNGMGCPLEVSTDVLYYGEIFDL